MWKLLLGIFKSQGTQSEVKLDTKTQVFGMPIRAGRSSVSPHELYYGMTSLEPEYGLQWLPIIQNLSIFHHDVKKAVDNIISLSNTELETEFDSAVSPRNATKMREYLTEFEKGWIKNGTQNTLINSLFRQMAVYGALSAERVINKELNGIDEIVMVSPQRIRFIYENGKYLPHQETPVLADTRLGLKQLNTTTYKYIPLVTENETPFGIPPFISALYMIGIERDMLANLANIAEKVGMFGFLEALLTPPDQKDGEDDDTYIERAKAYRDNSASEISKTIKEGYVVGFAGSHSFNIAGSVNATGAEKMLEMVDTLKMAGLGQDPNLFGRHSTVTETFGRVLLAIMITQTELYQEIVADFMADTKLLALKLAGFSVKNVKCKFKAPLIGDELKKEQTREKKIDNLLKLYLQGIISQTKFANEVGYDSPYLPEPLAIVTPSNGNANPSNGRDNPTSKTESESNGSLYPNLYRAYPAFTYAIPSEYGDNYGRTDWKDALTQSLANKYLDEVEKLYAENIVRIIKRVGEELGKLRSPTLALLQSTILSSLLVNWSDNFAKEIPKLAKRNVSKIYRVFRKDTTIFPKETSSANSLKAYPPKVSLDLFDTRVMKYMTEHDTIFLSKFITDEDTNRRILNFITAYHIENGEAIGNNEGVIKEFKDQFQNVLNGEAWKIRRVLDTTVSKLRSYGNINYMHQANVKTFTIVEVLDRITCRHCQHLDGKTFEVVIARNKIERVVNASVEEVDSLSPFATSYPVDEFEDLIDSELQGKGFDSPPFHPSCRGRVVVSG